MDPLKVITTEEKTASWVSSKKNYRQESQAKFERLWNLYPRQFNPARNCMESERLERTIDLIKANMTLENKRVADLGCGGGALTRLIRDLGPTVDAVDIASNAINRKDEERISYSQDYVPRTKLLDDHYDLVVASELIAYLHPDEYRLTMAEIARIVKAEGHVVVSTPIDINSDDALSRFQILSETEFILTDSTLSHHRYWIRLHDFFASPGRFWRAYEDAEYRKLKLNERSGTSYVWFKINSIAPLAFLWRPIELVTAPINHYINKSVFFLRLMEKICQTLAPVRGVSHIIWFGKRRPMIEHTPVSEQPEERKGKKQVWE